VRLGLTVWATLVGALLVMPSARAADLSPKLKELLREAKALQDNGEYAQSWEKYHQIRKAERNPPAEVTEGYQFCLRRIQQVRRLHDKPSQALLGNLSDAEALTLYAEVLDKLQNKYVDRGKVSVAALFQYGVQEMRFALEDKEFLKDHLSADAKPEGLDGVKALLDGLRINQPDVKKPAEAREQLKSVMLPSRALGIKPTPVLVEFICGACNALDEYTGYLSPRRLAEAEVDLNGKFVGIGIDVAVRDNGMGGKVLVVARVYANSPAVKELAPDDVILSIDGQAPDPAAPAALVAKLQGEAGSKVELEVTRLGSSEGMKRKVKVERQPVVIPSVEEPEVYESGVGYVRLTSFQKTTPQELRSALLLLRSQPVGLKALVLDLRGNLGGSFEAALQVAEMFLSDGVIVYTQTSRKEKPWRANNPDALTVPLVVLVDGDTASAAEIVAGALKDNNRATLVGQPTYGKGSIQDLLPLKSLKSALQVTVARFSSPERVPYDGHGVTPHEVVENGTAMMMTMADPQKDRALKRAEELAKMSPPPKMPVPR
jgi:carboxyl-terminal processing protease